MIVSLTVLFSLMSLGSQYIVKNAEFSVNQAAAYHLQQITLAAQQYVKDHFQDFKDNSNEPLDLDILADKGYLPANIIKKNHYRQDYQFTVQNSNENLQVLLLTHGGNIINEPSLRQIAALVGSTAGYTTVLHEDQIVGNHESWSLSASESGDNWEPGHLASMFLVNSQDVMDASSFLRRKAVTGHLEYNQMETDLHLVDNNIKGSLTGILSKDRLQFTNKEDKYIDIYNDKYPHMEIKDNTLTDGANTMHINSGNIYMDKEKKKIRLGIDKPELTLEDSSKQWKTEILLAEIRLGSQQSGNYSYVGNDKITLTDNSGNHSYLGHDQITVTGHNEQWSSVLAPASLQIKNSSAGEETYINSNHIQFTHPKGDMTIYPWEIKTATYPYTMLGKTTISDYRGFFGALHNQYVKVPFIEVYDNFSEAREKAVQICGAKEREGAIFLVGLRGNGSRVLAICADGRARQISKWG